MVLGAVRVTVPLHTVADAFGTVSPAGKVSVKPTPVRLPEAFEFVIVNVSAVVAPNAIGFGLNAFAIDGGAPVTVIDADAVLPLPPSLEVTALVVAVKLPTDAPVTVTEN